MKKRVMGACAALIGLCAWSGIGLAQPAAQPNVYDAFKKFDLNGDGVIDLYEAIQAGLVKKPASAVKSPEAKAPAAPATAPGPGPQWRGAWGPMPGAPAARPVAPKPEVKAPAARPEPARPPVLAVQPRGARGVPPAAPPARPQAPRLDVRAALEARFVASLTPAQRWQYLQLVDPQRRAAVEKHIREAATPTGRAGQLRERLRQALTDRLPPARPAERWAAARRPEAPRPEARGWGRREEAPPARREAPRPEARGWGRREEAPPARREPAPAARGPAMGPPRGPMAGPFASLDPEQRRAVFDKLHAMTPEDRQAWMRKFREATQEEREQMLKALLAPPPRATRPAARPAEPPVPMRGARGGERGQPGRGRGGR